MVRLSSKVTVLAGRPGSGKTAFAREIAESFYRNKKRVIYYHAEGPMELHESNFEFRGPDELSYFNYVPDIYSTRESLLDLIGAQSKTSEDLVVIDTIDLFDWDSHDLIKCLSQRILKSRSMLLILTMLPRKFEAKPVDFAEAFIRKKFDLKSEAVLVLGDFPVE